MSAAPTSNLVLLAIAAVLAAVGIFLLKRGRWPRRVGNTAHCGTCDYILSGAQSKCPECGSVVRGETIVRGERHRRPALAWSGLGLALFGLAVLGLFLTQAINGINWDQYKPLGWLLHDLNTPHSSRQAWAEIQRRLNAGQVSESDQTAIVEKGLQVQASAISPIPSPNIIDFVGQRFLDHKLTAGQAKQFFAVALNARLAVRPTVGARSPIPYSLLGGGPGPAGWWLRVRTLEMQVDQGPVQRLNGAIGTSFGNWSWSSSMPPAGTPGKHRLRVKVEMATGLGTSNWDNNATVPNKVTKDLNADFQAIEGQTVISTITSPSAATLASLLTPRLTFNSADRQMQTNVDTSPLPVDVAFDVFARFNGTEYRLGSVSFHKGAPGGSATGSSSFPVDPPSKVGLILRSNEDVARGTLDIMRIWKGQIIIPNVAVQQLPAAAPATQSS